MRSEIKLYFPKNSKMGFCLLVSLEGTLNNCG